MRLSIDDADPAGYATWQALRIEGGRARVFLDGVEVHAIMADDEKGEVIFFPQKDGQFQLTPDGGGLVREKATGVVRIETFKERP